MSRTLTGILIVYLAFATLVGLLMMAWDKWRSKKEGAHRVPEKALFLVAVFGGSLGIWAGMYIFHHKTRHFKFVAGIPLIFVLQVAFVIWAAMGFPLGKGS